jgi:NADH:ubiquinone oxidoreductase subunit F (NADH-binding)
MSALVDPEVTMADRLLAGTRPSRPLTLNEHLNRHGKLPDTRGSLTGTLEASGLGGRGGAGFPSGRKLRTVGEQKGRPVVLINATEGEPLSLKDKYLLTHTPHLVLDGAAAMARELGTNDIFVGIASDARSARTAFASAIGERRRERLDGTLQIEIVDVPSRFIAGEETALVSIVNGGSGLPQVTPPRPYERGVAKRPTLVQNAETVAHAALIARYGAPWFREIGTNAEPGTALFTLAGAVRTPGVVEAPIGTSLAALVQSAGGLTRSPQAVLVGGYFGTWFTASDAARLTLDDATLRPLGGGLGARAVAVLPEGACGLCETARVARYLAQESARQCGPCLNGLAAIAGALAKLTKGDEQAARRVTRWAEQIRGRGACHHPDGAARFVASGLTVFAHEIGPHASGRGCPHGHSHMLPIGREAR